jgi:hypothetical protein
MGEGKQINSISLVMLIAFLITTDRLGELKAASSFIPERQTSVMPAPEAGIASVFLAV